MTSLEIFFLIMIFALSLGLGITMHAVYMLMTIVGNWLQEEINEKKAKIATAQKERISALYPNKYPDKQEGEKNAIR